jgi:hypothetical protein
VALAASEEAEGPGMEEAEEVVATAEEVVVVEQAVAVVVDLFLQIPWVLCS